MGPRQQGTENAEKAVQRTITEAALAGERAVSVARLVFCAVVGARATWYWLFTDAHHKLERAWMSYPALAAAIALSLAVLLGRTRTWRAGVVLHLSVATDALVAFVVLVPNALWPGPGYQGAPFLIDTSALLVLTMAAGLRHSRSAAALAGGLNGAALAGLAIADHAAAGISDVDLLRGYTMYGLLLVTVAALALIIARRTRALVERAARAAVAAERAGDGLRALLHGHHDLRTVIASAQINADLLARRLGPRAPTDENMDAMVAHLREDLGELRAQVEQVKGRALEELAGLEARTPVAVDPTLADVIAALAPRFPRVAIEADGGARSVLVAGGPQSLRRIVANLVINACEGDGRRAARRVDVRARESGAKTIAIEILDDGPGLPAHVLAVPPGEGLSTKPVGTGVGIGLVDGLVRASGGSLSWTNREGGGARVVVELPAADVSA